MPNRVQGIDCGDGVASWLYNVLGRHCRLLQMDSGLQRKMNWQSNNYEIKQVTVL